MKTIKIIGDTGVGEEAIRIAQFIEQQEKQGVKVVFIPPKQSDIIEIDGIKYREKQQKQRGSQGLGYMNRIAMLTLMFNSFDTMNNRTPRKRPDVDILTEYQLVLAKKSNLSKSNRDWVESMFKNLYETVQ